MTCPSCVNALVSSDRTAHPFVDLVDRGKLVRPSKSAVAVCLQTERVLQGLLKSSGRSLPQGSGLHTSVASSVLETTSEMHLFDKLLDHQYDAAVEDNHIHLPVKNISSFFARYGYTYK